MHPDIARTFSIALRVPFASISQDAPLTPATSCLPSPYQARNALPSGLKCIGRLPRNSANAFAATCFLSIPEMVRLRAMARHAVEAQPTRCGGWRVFHIAGFATSRPGNGGLCINQKIMKHAESPAI